MNNKGLFSGSFSCIKASKLKATKGISRGWNKLVFDRAETKKSEALCKVSLWDD